MKDTKMIDDDCIKLRHHYMSCIKLAQETDSKKEDKYLRDEAGVSLSKLREICHHNETVCLRSEYGGSYSMDYDDHHPEERICLCCGLSELAYDNQWKALKTTPFARFEGKYPDQMENCLSYLLAETLQIAEEKGYKYFGGKHG